MLCFHNCYGIIRGDASQSLVHRQNSGISYNLDGFLIGKIVFDMESKIRAGEGMTRGTARGSKQSTCLSCPRWGATPLWPQSTQLVQGVGRHRGSGLQKAHSRSSQMRTHPPGKAHRACHTMRLGCMLKKLPKRAARCCRVFEYVSQ